MPDFNHILMVCAGNLCRSPMAEYLLQSKWERGTGDTESNVTSAGIIANNGRIIDPVTRDVLHANGIDARNHWARRLDVQNLSRADLVLVMEQYQLRFIHESYPHMRGRVKMLTEWLGGHDIDDPYGKPREYYEQAFDLIERATESWLPYLD